MSPASVSDCEMRKTSSRVREMCDDLVTLGSDPAPVLARQLLTLRAKVAVLAAEYVIDHGPSTLTEVSRALGLSPRTVQDALSGVEAGPAEAYWAQGHEGPVRAVRARARKF